MRALVISPQPFFSPRGTPFSVYYRTLITAELGVKIDLLTYGQGQDVDLPGVRIIRIPRFSFLGPVKVGPSGLKLFLDFFLFFWTVALLIRHRYDFVQAHEEAVFFCYFLKPLFRFKLVYDMHSSLPQQLANFQFSRSRWLTGFFEKMEKACLKKSEAVITICPDLYAYAEGVNPDPRKHFLIENSIFDRVRLREGQDQSPGRREERRASLPAGKLLVVYAGTLEPYQGIEILLQAFSRVIKANPRSFLLVVGGTPDQVTAYQKMARALELDRDVLFTGRVNQELAQYYSGLAAVLVSPRSRGTNTPLKIYEQLHSGIPLVATDIYSHTQVLNPEVAFLVKPEPDDMARGILAALDNDSDGSKKAAQARLLYERQYARPIYRNKISRLLAFIQSCVE